jgi:hypothetical protein
VGAAAVAALAAGGGAALAVDRTSQERPESQREAFLEDVAGRLGVSVEDLRKAFREAAEARGWRRGPGDGFAGPHGRRGHGHGHARHWHAVREAFDAAGDYLGLSRGELKRRLRDGDSLADVAEAEGRSLDGLKQAIRASIAARVGDAADKGKLSEQRKQRLLARLDALVDDLVQRSRPPRN